MVEMMKGKRIFQICLAKNYTLYVVVCMAVIIALCFIIWSCNEIWKQLFAVILSALLGAFVVTLTTKKTLREEKEREEWKEKSIKIYENKICSFSDFVPQMFGLIKKDNDLTDSDLLDLRQLLFCKSVLLYLSKENAEKINSILQNLVEQRTRAPRSFSEIVTVLSNDLEQNTEGEVLYSIWEQFIGLKKENYEDGIIVENESIGVFWHFCMLGREQIDYFEKHKNKDRQNLSLIEYDEVWRTETLKRVKPGDIVFLFQRGGSGYIGVFRVIETRVFDNRGDKTLEYINDTPQGIEQTQRDIQSYDIYNSIEDRATFCSNLIVTPLAFVHEGVGNPGGVYRKTISRYDETYAKQLLGRFLYMKKVQGKGLNMKCDEEQFYSLIKEFGIKESNKEVNGIWEDNN